MNVGYPGNLQTDIQPLVSAGVSELRALARAIGVNPQRFEFHPEDARAIESFTLEHLAAGNPVYIGSSITSAMQSANAGIFRLMPMLRADGIEFVSQWFEVVPEIAVETPAQAPPNYLEIKERQQTATLTRHALGVTATVQELRTAKGQFFFMGKLIYLTVAFVEAAEMHAFQALVETPTAYANYVLRTAAWEMDLARAGRARDEFWDILRRSPNGFFELRDSLENEFAGKNLFLTHVLMREGVRSVIANSPMRTQYFLRGPGAADNAEQLADSIGDVIGGLEIIVVRAYRYEEKDLAVDPLDRHSIIGAHFRMAPNFHPQCGLDKWCSAMMEIEIYSVNDDDWQRIDLKTAINESGRFSDDGKLHPWHDELITGFKQYANANQRSVPIFDSQYDMFLYLVEAPNGETYVNKTAVIGHMEPWALTEETVMRTARGIVNYVKTQMNEKELDAIRIGLDDIATLYETVPTVLQNTIWRASTANGRYGAPRLLPRTVVAGLSADGANLTNFRPSGYGTVAGYLELGSAFRNPELAYIDQALAERAQNFANASVKLHQAFRTVFDDRTHPALVPAFAPQYLRASSATKNSAKINSSLNFLQNIVDQNKAVLVFSPAAGEREPALAPSSGVVTLQALPEDSPYAPVVDRLRIYPDPIVARVFMSPETLGSFEARFAASEFGKKYAAYLKKRRPPVSEDGEQATTILADGGPLFEQFVTNEVLTRPSVTSQVALLKNAIRNVEQGTAPRQINANILAGLASDEAAALRPQVERRPAPAGARPVGLAVSVDALLEAPDAVRRDLGIMSPITPGQVLRVEDLTEENLRDLDSSGPNNNVTRLVTFASARASRVMPGARGEIPTGEEREGISAFDGAQLPSFAFENFVDIVGADLVENTNLSTRYEMFGNMADPLLRIAGQMLVLAPVHRQTFLSFVDRDVPQPVGFLIEQFNRRYVTSSMVFISQNPDQPIGNIYFLDPDMHVGRDAIRKTIMYHMSMYLGAVINDPKRYFIAHDVFVVGYMGGENAVPFDQESFSAGQLDILDEDGPSLLFFMEPAHVLIGGTPETKVPTTHDIRGYSERLGNARASALKNERPHHPSALYYTTKLDLDSIKRMGINNWFDFTRLPGIYNTVTHQGAQRVMTPAKEMFESYLTPHDPFGTAVGPGSRKLRATSAAAHYPTANPFTGNTIAI